MDSQDFIGVPEKIMTEVPQIQGYYQLMTNRWWAIDKNGDLLFHKKTMAPQCNTDERLVRRLMKTASHPCVNVRFVSQVWLKHKCAEL